MAMQRRWTLLTAMALAGALAACGEDRRDEPAPPEPAPHDDHGRGESSEYGGEDLAPAARRVYLYAQMRGHLAVAKALYDSGETEAGEPHFMHPVVEVLDDYPDVFEPSEAAALETDMTTLATAVGEGEDQQAVEALYNDIVARLDAAVSAAPLADHAAGLAALLALGAHEYEEGVAGGAVVDAIEYHDSWGFITAARYMFAARRADYNAADASAAAEIETALRDLMRVRGDANAAPPVPVAEMDAATARAEAALSPFMD